jgi:hypothetical protein
MDEPAVKIIDVFICKLRKKLANASMGKNYIETIWGGGHVLREPTDTDANAGNGLAPVSWTGEALGSWYLS